MQQAMKATIDAAQDEHTKTQALNYHYMFISIMHVYKCVQHTCNCVQVHVGMHVHVCMHGTIVCKCMWACMCMCVSFVLKEVWFTCAVNDPLQISTATQY